MAQLTILISENPDYNTDALTSQSLIDYKLSIVNNGNKRSLIYASSGRTTLFKLNKQLENLQPSANDSIQVELDLSVISESNTIPFATISEDSELAKSFQTNAGGEYPHIFATTTTTIEIDPKFNEETTTTSPINPINIYLINETAMKYAISHNGGGDWENQTINIVDVQDRVSELEGIIKSTQLKLQSYKNSTSKLAYKGLGIAQAEQEFVRVNGSNGGPKVGLDTPVLNREPAIAAPTNIVPLQIENLYNLYTKLATYTTLTGDMRTKLNLITNIYNNYVTLVGMIDVSPSQLIDASQQPIKQI